MPAGEIFNSFDEDEYDSHPQDQAQVYHEEGPTPAVDELMTEGEAEAEPLDEQMTEAGRRISLAGYYMQLTRGGVFNDGSEEAATVDAELKQFARERMDALLNLGNYKPKVEMPFTDGQVEVLRALADRYAQKQSVPVQPQVRPLTPPQAPAAPVAARPLIPQVKPLAPPPNAGKPVQAAPKPARAKLKPVAKPPVKDPRNYDDIPFGEIFVENGKKYKFVEHPENGSRLKVHVTAGQVRGKRGIPMPSARDMEYITEQNAQQNLNANPALKNDRIALGVAMSQTDTTQVGGK